MKQKIDRLAGAIVLGFHIYCDVIFGAVLAVVGAAGFYHSFFIRIMREPVAAVDTARFFPQLVFGALIPVGIVMALLGIRKIKVNRGSAPTGQVLDNSVQALERGIIILLSIAVFIALMAPLGFIPTAILYMVFSMLFISTKDGWKPVIYVVTAVVVAIACFFLFRKFVYVELPTGLLEGVLG